MEQVDLATGKNRTPEMLAKNPAGGLPFVELDDGTHLAESVAICRYLEGLHPEPNLMGKDSREQAFIEMWNRRVELNLFAAAARAFQHTNEMFKTRIKQFPEYGATQKETVANQFKWLDAQIGNKPYIAGDRFTIADITGRGCGRFRRTIRRRPDGSCAEEPRAMASVGIESSQRQGVGT